MQNSIGLFYGSSTCYTEMAAEKIRDAIQAQCLNKKLMYTILPITAFI